MTKPAKVRHFGILGLQLLMCHATSVSCVGSE